MELRESNSEVVRFFTTLSMDDSIVKRLKAILEKETVKYTIKGVLFGLMFPIVATLLELFIMGLSFDWVNIINIQKEDYHLWIIDAAPFVLGGVAYIAGRKSENLIETYNEVAQSNERYSKLFEQSTEGILLVDPYTGLIFDVNSTALDIYGYTRDEIIGKPTNMFLPEHKKHDYDGLWEKIKKEGKFMIESERLRKDGTLFWAEISIGIVEKKARKIYQTCIRDISARKELERERENQIKAQIEVNRMLELKVNERTEELSGTNNLLTEKNKELTDSITYARRLQRAILPGIEVIRESFPGSFVYYRPRDIVSGDFYWFYEWKGNYIVAIADCTGHGVPGAFMSILGVEMLNKAIIEEGMMDPGEILQRIDVHLAKALKTDNKNEIKDGMDMSLCVINKKEKIVKYAGAALPLIHGTKEGLNIYKGSRFGIGVSGVALDKKNYVTQTFSYKEGEGLFFFSDGYMDQFGGPKGKKLMMRGFKELLMSLKDVEKGKQQDYLHKHFEEWKGDYQQVDDVVVAGICLE